MQAIFGLTDEQVAAYEMRAETAMLAALQQVMDVIADRIAKIQTAGAYPYSRQRVLVAADGIDFPDDGLPPGQPYVSPDDLASIKPLWNEAVDQQLMPVVSEVWRDSSGTVYANMVDATAISALPSVGSLAAEQYLAQARNTFEQVGDELWGNAQAQLLEGFENGESIPQLETRLRSSAGITGRKATLVARTQVIEASNAGSYATAQASGLRMQKEYFATPDARTRPTHLAADGQRVPLSEPFIIGGYEAMYPAAPSLPPAERYSCRCTLGYIMSDSSVKQGQRDAVPEPPLPGQSGGVDELAAQQAAEVQRVFGEVDQAFADLGLPEVPPIVRRPATPSRFGLSVPEGFEFPAAPEHPVRAALLRAKTPQGLQRAWRAEFQRITGRDVLIQVPDIAGDPISMPTWRAWAEGTLRGFEEFPETRIREISWFNIVDGDYALTGGQSMRFNAWWGSEAHRAEYLRSIRRDGDWRAAGRNGWFAQGTGNPTGLALHEFGHLLDMDNLGERVHSRALSLAQGRATRAGIDSDTLVSQELGNYAVSDEWEMIAEAFGDVMANGEAASPLSKEIFALLRAEYDKTFVIGKLPPPSAITRPARAAAGGLNAKTVPQLRTLARERGVAIPVGAKKADIVRLLDEGAAPRATVRTGQAALDSAVHVEDVDALLLRAGVPEGDRLAAQLQLSKYSQSNFRNANRSLYGEQLGDIGRMQAREMIAGLDPVFANARLADDIVVFRGDKGGLAYRFREGQDFDLPPGVTRLDVDNPDFDLTGAEWTSPAYESTSASRKVAEAFSEQANPDAPLGRSTVLTIRAPKGTPAVTFSRELERHEAEITLGRGQRFRVVADHGLDSKGVRRLDVEVIPSAPVKATKATKATKAVKAVAPKVPPQTIAQLRATATQRGIPVPAKATKAELQRLTALPDAEVKALQVQAKAAAAAERAALIESRTATANLLAEVDELVSQGASKATILARLSGTDEVTAALRAAVQTGDPAKLRAALSKAGTKAKVKPISKAGAKVKYDADTMEVVGGGKIPAGGQVVVVSRGSTLTLPDGEVIQIAKARVAPIPKKVIEPVEGERYAGRDILDEVKNGSYSWIGRAQMRSFSEPGDRVLTELVKRQAGWSAPGKVVTKAQLDRAIASGWTENWRGIQRWSSTYTPRRIAKETRTGEWVQGQGIYGNGLHTSVRRTTAETYRDAELLPGRTIGGPRGDFGPAPLYEWDAGFDVPDYARGGLMRMAIDPRAKIIDYEQLNREHIAYLRSIGFSPNGVPRNDYESALYDSSFYAVLRGYDGVRIRGRVGFNDGSPYPPGVDNVSEADQYIIFNRSILMFEGPSSRYDT